MIAIFARPDDARVLVEGEGDLRFERQAGAFEDDLGGEFINPSLLSLQHNLKPSVKSWAV